MGNLYVNEHVKKVTYNHDKVTHNSVSSVPSEIQERLKIIELVYGGVINTNEC